jgi:hypothetical protein
MLVLDPAIAAQMSEDERAASAARVKAGNAASARRERAEQTEQARHLKRMKSIKAAYEAELAAAHATWKAAEEAAFSDAA